MRMNGKKLTVLLGTAVLAMGILAGCGSWGDIRSRDSRPGNNRRNIRRGF